MGSDRARSTYDRTRQYRRVVSQQGRVVVEADLNEFGEILTEDARGALIDVVGPYGVPRDARTRARGHGYAITGFRAGDFDIGRGAIYVGGLRVEQQEPELTYSTQTEGLERWPHQGALEPWTDGDPYALAMLYLREQEVSATEDTTLLDVALGGPDTAQRLRLVRRVVLARTENTTRAFVDAMRRLEEFGHDVDPRQTRLERRSRLRVDAADEADDGGRHEPRVRRNYLGAENQLIRVQIARGGSSILWGYDNASCLYRVDAATDLQTLTLRSAPVDVHHYPRKGQVVEVLEATARLGPSGVNWMAAPYGLAYRLAAEYTPDAQTVRLAEPLPADFASDDRPLFLRVWDNEQLFKDGVSLPLVDERRQPTGLDVTLSEPPFVPGDFWCFAVRPAEPTKVDPPRYSTPQPPDGPREWLCPLAFVDCARGEVLDLRPSFDALVDRRGPILVSPRDLDEGRSLQSLLDAAVAIGREPGGHVTVRLEPGLYPLLEPVRLGPGHSDLTIEGAGDGVLLQASVGCDPHAFHNGMMIVIGANRVTIREIEFELTWQQAWPTWFEREELKHHKLSHELRVAVGLRPIGCMNLQVRGCTFRFAEPPSQHPVFGAAVFPGGTCLGFQMRDTRVEMPRDMTVHREYERLVYGYALVPSLLHGGGASDTVSPVLADASFRDNSFSGLTAALMIRAQLGSLRLEGNEVSESEGGFWIFSLADRSLADWVLHRKLHQASLRVFLQDERLRRSASIAHFYRIEIDRDQVPSLVQPEPQVMANMENFTDHHPVLSWLFGRLHIRPEEGRHARAAGRRFVFHAANNRVEAAGSLRAGAALLLVNTEPESASSVIVSSNQFENVSLEFPTVVLFTTGRSVIAGNIIVNGAAGTLSAPFGIVFAALRDGEGKAGDLIAITGNVFEGDVQLPDRHPKHLPEWKTYNDVRG